MGISRCTGAMILRNVSFGICAGTIRLAVESVSITMRLAPELDLIVRDE